MLFDVAAEFFLVLHCYCAGILDFEQKLGVLPEQVTGF